MSLFALLMEAHGIADLVPYLDSTVVVGCSCRRSEPDRFLKVSEVLVKAWPKEFLIQEFFIIYTIPTEMFVNPEKIVFI